MKLKDPKFLLSATRPENYLPTDLKEIAFVGRSNVGKSSLINMLLARRNLAKTSSTPGKTKLINFFSVDDKFILVDLPGYGYAKVSKQMKKNWEKLINTYLTHRENLLEIILLVDLRHPPTDADIKMYNFIISSNFNGIVVGTKADKLSKTELEKNKKIIVEKLNMVNKDFLIPTSSETRYGKYDVWDALNEIFSINQLDIHFERQVKEK